MSSESADKQFRDMLAPVPQVVLRVGAGQVIYIVARLSAAAILFLAALLKAYEVGAEPAASMLAEVGLIAGELGLALWLIGGRGLKWSQWAAMVVFVGFVTFNAWQLYQGAADCGCFGPVAFSPLATLIIDLGVLVLLSTAALIPMSTNLLPRLSVGQLLGAAGVGLVVLLGAATLGVSGVTGEQPISASGSFQPLRQREPATWPGHTLPLMNAIVDAEPIRSGKWTVLLYHHACPDCQQALKTWLEKTKDAKADHTAHRALVELPPDGRMLGEWQAEDRGWHVTRVSAEHRMQFRTPLFVRLRDGRVVEVSHDL
jgi:hypothetical protein